LAIIASGLGDHRPKRVRHSEPQAKNPRDARRANDAESFYWGLVIIGTPLSFCSTTPKKTSFSRFGNVAELTRQTTELSIDPHDNA